MIISPVTPTSTKKKHRFRCLHCRERAPVGRICRLCKTCFARRARPAMRAYFDDDKPAPKASTQALPGSAEKIKAMRRRLLRGEALFHPDDCRDFANATPGSVQPQAQEQVRRISGLTGVERDGTKWRARPCYLGVKHKLGTFRTETAAVKAVEQFWIRKLGLFAPVRDQMAKIVKRPAKAKKRKVKKRTSHASKDRASPSSVGRRRKRQQAENHPTLFDCPDGVSTV